jgi:TetR/AcrR family transcriptional repressor of nem operon
MAPCVETGSTMRYPPSETAEKHVRILNEALRLFRERGFPDVSISEIMKATGLTHGSFYNHFESKEALIAESLDHGLYGTLASLDRVPATAAGRAKYAKSYLSTRHRDELGTGCLISGLVADVRQEPKARAPFTRLLKAFIEKIAFRFPSRSKDTARGDSIRMVSSLVGALMLSRAVDDEAFSEEILREVRKQLT